MTTLLTREQVDTLRSIGDSALVLMALWMIDCNYPGRASKAQEIAMCIRKDVRTVEKQLNELCATNRAANTSAGYILLESGRALILGMNYQALALSPENAQALVTEAQALTAPLSAITPTSPHLEIHKMGGEVDAHNVCGSKSLVVGVRDSLNLVIESLTPTPESGAQNVQFQSEPFEALTALQVLEASTILFGEDHQVLTHHLCMELLEKDVKYVLAVLAHCYDNRQTRDNPRGLHTPAGVAYRMLQAFPIDPKSDEKSKKPRRQYLIDPWSYLPNEFAEQFGLIEYSCDICDAKFMRQAEHAKHMKQEHPVTIACEECGHRFPNTQALEAHIEQEHPAPPEAAAPEPMQEIEDEEVRHAWHTVLGLLAAEMPKASFETWVKDAVAVRYDGHTLTVGCRNQYARDWLDSRLKTTIERLLAGTAGLGMFASVEFAVMGGEHEADD